MSVVDDLTLRSIERSSETTSEALKGIETTLDHACGEFSSLDEIHDSLEAIAQATERIATALEEMLRGIKEDAADAEKEAGKS